MYTKMILTVIAVALVTLVIQNFSESKVADAASVHELNQLSVNADGTLNVRLVETDVNIKSIGGSSVYGAIPVNLKELNGSSISSYGIPVNIESINGSSVYDAIPVKTKQ
ncbi:MAG: hypothetical protein IT233_10110 [Bacteroidia bacterium]|nr:hypothetical protein [Bacteroidia bacterium]